MKNVFLLFFLLPFFAFSQKSEQVKNYLGESRFVSDSPEKGSVTFRFQKGDLKRSTDGSQTYIQLLPAAPGYSDDDNAGHLESILNNGRLVPKFVVEKPARSEGVSARTMPAEMMGGDSLTYAEQIDQFKKQGTIWESKMWLYIKPTWGLIIYFFWILFPILLLLIGIFWFWASLFASEEFPRLHYGASKSLTFLVGTVFTVFFVNIFMELVSMEMGLIGLVFCVACLAIAAFMIAKRLIPNFHQKFGGRPGISGPIHNNNQQRLNG